MSHDLKFVASQFRRLHNKQLQHTFKFHSQQWRTWGATFIQAAWRRHRRWKILRSLQEAEDRQLQDALMAQGGGGGTSPSLGSTIYASRFAANMLGALWRNHPRTTNLSPMLLPILPQKPAEPDFSRIRNDPI